MLMDEQIGRYKIIEKIGSGGMGEVYLAEDTKLSRLIALKTLPPDVASDSERMSRFMHEAKTASGLNHPNIITIYEINDESETPFIAMEYVKGDTLAKIIKNKRLELSTILDISSQVAGALAAAHDANVVHRDIKPDNIIRRPDGLVKVLDFGLAKLTENDGSSDPEAETVAHRTNPGMILGTASFMSPEQARGKEIDGRSDIFSFGIVLYQLISGRLPFRGENYVDVIGAILHKEPPSLTDLVEDCPPEIDTLVRKCLRKNRDERFQSTRELLADINDLKQTLNLEIRSGQREPRGSDPAIRLSTDDAMAARLSTATNTRFATSTISRMIAEEIKLHPLRAFGVMLLVVLGLGASSLGLSRLTASSANEFESMRFAKVTTSGNIEQMMAAISPEGKLVAYVNREPEGESLWIKQTVTPSAIQLTKPEKVGYTSLAFSPDSAFVYAVRKDEAGTSSLYQVNTLGGALRKIAADVDGAITFSPDGTRIAFLRTASSIKITGAQGGQVQNLHDAANGEKFTSLAWAPNGETIVASYFSSADSLYHLSSINSVTGEMSSFPSPPWIRMTGHVWLQDSSGLIISGRDRETQIAQLWFLSFPDGEVSRITNDLANYHGVSVAADGSAIVSVQETRQSNIWVTDEKGETATRITSGLGTDDGMAGVAYSPDGRVVYTVLTGAEQNLWITSIDGKEAKRLTYDSRTNHSPTVTPDSRSVVFVSTRAGSPDVWQMDVNGENALQLSTDPGVDLEPAVSPDGRWVYYSNLAANDRISLWRVPIGGGTPVRITDGVDSSRPRVSPDGKQIAFLQGEGNPGSPFTLGLMSPDGGGIRTLDAPDVVRSRIFRWSQDSTSLIFIRRNNDVDNLWAMPLGKGEPVQLTRFESDRIFRFDVLSTGGFVVARGNESSDVVMVTRPK